MTVSYEIQIIQIGSNDRRARRHQLFTAAPKCGSSNRWQYKQHQTTVKYFEQLTDVFSGFRQCTFSPVSLHDPFRHSLTWHLHDTCSK